MFCEELCRALWGLENPSIGQDTVMGESQGCGARPIWWDLAEAALAPRHGPHLSPGRTLASTSLKCYKMSGAEGPWSTQKGAWCRTPSEGVTIIIFNG